MFTRKNSIEYAQEFVNKIIAKGIAVKHAKLFGSYAKNTQKDYSDVDILLVGDEFTGVGFIDNLLIADELIEFDSVQVKTYPVQDYDEGDPLIDEINKTGYQLRVN